MIKPMSTISYRAKCDVSISNLWRFAIKQKKRRDP
jgi:hypothetical protein